MKQEDEMSRPQLNCLNDTSSSYHVLRGASRDINYQSYSILGKRARQENGLVELTKKFI